MVPWVYAYLAISTPGLRSHIMLETDFPIQDFKKSGCVWHYIGSNVISQHCFEPYALHKPDPAVEFVEANMESCCVGVLCAWNFDENPCHFKQSLKCERSRYMCILTTYAIIPVHNTDRFVEREKHRRPSWQHKGITFGGFPETTQ